MEVFKVPAGEIETRIQRLQQKMQKRGMEGLLIVQRVDLFYFTGTAQNAFLYVPCAGGPLLLVKKYFPRAVKESAVQRVTQLDKMRDMPGLIEDGCGRLPACLGLELDVMPVVDFRYYESLFKGKTFKDASPLILETRMVKSPWEIEQMEKTAAVSRKTFDYMRSVLRPGLTEMAFAAMAEAYSRTLGHGAHLFARHYQARIYPWHVLSGENSAMVGDLDAPASGAGTSPAFPSGASSRKIRENEPVMVDFGTVLNGYHMDETRMFAIGRMPEKAMRVCEASIAIHDRVLEAVRPGVVVSELYNLSVETAESLGCGDAFLGPKGYKVSFVGHGIGLELTEPPFIAKGKKDRLEPGMTFSLEPKLVFENAFSAGVESVFTVTETGHRLLSRVPVEVFVC